MGEMSDYYSGYDYDPYEYFNPKDDVEVKKSSDNEQRSKTKLIFVLQGYKEGQLVIDRHIDLTEEQENFFKTISNGNKRFKLLNEDVEEVYGKSNKEYEYFLEIK